jgi:ligand-binding sensor domain-containing protein
MLVPAIVIDNQGNKWFGTFGGGVSKFDGSVWKTYNPMNSGLSNGYVHAVAVDSKGIKWFGTFGGGVSVMQDHE